MSPPVTKKSITRYEAEKQPYLGVANSQGKYEKVIFPSDLEVGLGGVPASLSLGGELNLSFVELDLRGKSSGKLDPNAIVHSVLINGDVTVYLPQPEKPGRYITIKDGLLACSEFNITVKPHDGGTKSKIDGDSSHVLTGAGNSATFVSTFTGWTIFEYNQSATMPLLIAESDPRTPSAAVVTAGPGIMTYKGSLRRGAAPSTSNQFIIGTDFDIVAARDGTTFHGNVEFEAGLSGSLQRLSSGIPYMVAGDHVRILTNSLGQIEISSIPYDDIDPFAALTSSFVVSTESPDLPNSKVIQAGNGISISSTGSNLVISSNVNTDLFAPIDSAYLTFSENSSLTNSKILSAGPGISLDLSGSHLQVSSNVVSAELLVISSSANVPNASVITAGPGVVMTQSGSNFVIGLSATPGVGMRTGVYLTGSSNVYTTPDKFFYVSGKAGVSIYVNGVRQYENIDYLVSESVLTGGYDTVTFYPHSTPEDYARVQADYIVNTATDVASQVRSNVVPIGVIDGVNDTFSLPVGEYFAYNAGLLSIDVYLNGVRQFLHEDFEISASTPLGYDIFVMKEAPYRGDRLLVDYVLPSFGDVTAAANKNFRKGKLSPLAGQSTLDFSPIGSLPYGYDPERDIDVYLNGVMLAADADYTINSSTQLTIAYTFDVNDIVTIAIRNSAS